jgi:ubiquinone/menaquinone biosynthesis C-methylase UbiE
MSSLVMQLGGRVPAPLHETAYRAQQHGMLYNCLLGQQFLRFVARKRVQVSAEAKREVDRRYQALLERDLANVADGMYPKSLLFQFPFVDYLRSAPALALDLPRTLWRMSRKNFNDLPAYVEPTRYPAYFRRNFHWQTDGYFSRRSADIYDIGVEFLFLGTADVMRRMVIPPVTRHVASHGTQLRLLDVGCGTGRMLHQLAIAHPRLRFYGLDLSPYYLQHARELLGHVEDLSLVADNAESMPFRDEFFDVVTSVHLMHELPAKARARVYRDMWRVLKPGGLLVIQDSAQMSESGELAFFLGRFSREFHEPFHAGYIRDDIGASLRAAGFSVDATEPHFVAKVVIAHKPQSAS